MPSPAPTLITLTISTYNRPAALDRVLSACMRQSDQDFEIVVADDGSTEATRDLVRDYRKRSTVPISHVWHPDDGFRLAEIRNKAIAQARGDYLIFLDGDCMPQRNFVAMHRALARPGAMLTGSRILLSERLTRRIESERLELSAFTAPSWIAARLRGDINKCLPLLLSSAALPGRRVDGFVWKSIKGCNMAAWTRDVVAVDGFDNSFTSWGHEDADFVARLHNAGIGRNKGFFATEVLHLWHREQPRDRESVNYQKVIRRLASGQAKALRGLAECRADTSTVVNP